MRWMSKKMRLLLAQADDLTGEAVGHLIPRLLEKGAANVQVIASITKKNRPGQVILVDMRPERLAAVLSVLLAESGISGYYILDGHHFSLEVSFAPKILRITLGDASWTRDFVVKYVGPKEHPFAIKVEHDFLQIVQKDLEMRGGTCSLKQLRALIESQLWLVDTPEILLSFPSATPLPAVAGRASIRLG